MIATTAERVSSNTRPDINAWIWRQTEEHMRQIAAEGREAIERRQLPAWGIAGSLRFLSQKRQRP